MRAGFGDVCLKMLNPFYLNFFYKIKIGLTTILNTRFGFIKLSNFVKGKIILLKYDIIMKNDNHKENEVQ